MNPLQPWSAATSIWVRKPSKVTPALSSTHGPSIASSRSAQAWWAASRSVRSSTGNSTFMMSVPTSWKLRAELMTLRRRRSRTSGSSIDSPATGNHSGSTMSGRPTAWHSAAACATTSCWCGDVGGVAVLAVEDHELGGVGAESRELRRGPAVLEPQLGVEADRAGGGRVVEVLDAGDDADVAGERAGHDALAEAVDRVGQHRRRVLSRARRSSRAWTRRPPRTRPSTGRRRRAGGSCPGGRSRSCGSARPGR